MNWVCIYRSTSRIKASMYEDVLKNRDIPVIVKDTLDSSYNDFGEIELKIPSEYHEKALDLLNHDSENTPHD